MYFKIQRTLLILALLLVGIELYPKSSAGKFHFVFLTVNTKDLENPIKEADAFFTDFVDTTRNLCYFKDVAFHHLSSNLDNLDKLAGNLHTSPDDVIFLYFIGHGEEDKSSEDGYPILKQSNGIGISLEKVYRVVSGKRHRLLILIAETCNAKDTTIFSSTEPPVASSNYDRPLHKIHPLFCGFEGDFVCVSAKPGQYSVFDKLTGFSCFLEAFKFVLSSNNLNDWNGLFGELVTTTEDNCKLLGTQYVQTPFLIKDNTTRHQAKESSSCFSLRAVASASLSASSFANSMTPPQLGIMADIHFSYQHLCGIYGKVVGNLQKYPCSYTIGHDDPFWAYGDIKVSSCSAVAGTLFFFDNLPWLHPYIGAGCTNTCR